MKYELGLSRKHSWKIFFIIRSCLWQALARFLSRDSNQILCPSDCFYYRIALQKMGQLNVFNSLNSCFLKSEQGICTLTRIEFGEVFSKRMNDDVRTGSILWNKWFLRSLMTSSSADKWTLVQFFCNWGFACRQRFHIYISMVRWFCVT